MDIPVETINKALIRAHRIFNEKLPFRVIKCELDADTKIGTWEGLQRVSTAKLKSENPENYEKMY